MTPETLPKKGKSTKTRTVAEQEALFQKWAEEDGGTLEPPPHPGEIKNADDLRHIWFTRIIGNSC